MGLDKFVSIKEKRVVLPEGFEYIEHFIDFEESMKLYRNLVEEIDWEEREIMMFGKKMMQPRLIKWFGEKEYTYSRQTFKPLEFPKPIQDLKEKIVNQFEIVFNSVLVNYYRNEQDSMGKHSDDEKELGFEPTIISVSLGEEREFIIIDKDSKEKTNINLKSGSLLIMSGKSQEKYWHELPKSKNPKKGRVNLTFRRIS